MGEMVEFDTEDATVIGAYKAAPSGAPKGGLVVVQEVFGVNRHIQTVADRFAAKGYAVLAPALFDWVERGVQLDYDEAGMTRGMDIANGISAAQHVMAIDAAIDEMAAFGPVGIVGFCLGGTLAYAAAARNASLKAAVCYYGGGIAAMAGSDLLCPVMMHFGETDPHIPVSDVETLRAAHPGSAIFTYPAGHGFNCDERASYDKPSADQAWTRTLAFLEKERGARGL